jgi:hypothetical protein
MEENLIRTTRQNASGPPMLLLYISSPLTPLGASELHSCLYTSPHLLDST